MTRIRQAAASNAHVHADMYCRLPVGAHPSLTHTHAHTPWPLRAPLQLFPYHLAEYVCRMMRLTPFRYYSSLLADAMREDLPYDAIPNFTVSLGVLQGGGAGYCRGGTA